MAAISLFRDTNMATVTSHENTLLENWLLLEWILQNMVRHFVTHKQVQAHKQHPVI